MGEGGHCCKINGFKIRKFVNVLFKRNYCILKSVFNEVTELAKVFYRVPFLNFVLSFRRQCYLEGHTLFR